MRSEDLEIFSEGLEHVASLVPEDAKVLILSPGDAELSMLRAIGFEPLVMSKDDWDINTGSLLRRHDLIVMSNVLMYVDSPQDGLRNVLDSCRHLLLLDSVSGRRGDVDGYLGNDGDRNRFSFSFSGSTFPRAIPLDDLLEKMSYLKTFLLPSERGNEARHFVAVIRGNVP